MEFEAKVSLISIVGVDVGSAKNCTPCPPGYRSSDGATQCTACLPGQYSSGNAASCSPCEGNTYTNKVGLLPQCLPLPCIDSFLGCGTDYENSNEICKLESSSIQTLYSY